MKYSKHQRTVFTEKADQNIVLHIWECDLLQELSPDQFIDRYQKVHLENTGNTLR